MPRVVSLIGYLPPPRYDGNPWTGVEISEAPDPDVGPWVVIDTLAFSDPDADPTKPKPRNVTTSNAQIADGWYRLVFLDATGGRSDASQPARSSSEETELPPSPDAIRNMSPLLRKKFPLPPTDDYAISDLRELVGQATALVQANTWRLIDPALGCPVPSADYQCEAVPAALVPVAFQAVTRMAERIYVTTAPDFAEQVATGRRLRGFNAGPYSESYFAPGEFARRGAQQGRAPMDADDALDQALWALATEDARDYFIWRATGVAPPVGQAVAFDYRRAHVGYGAGGLGGPGFGRGPDGY